MPFSSIVQEGQEPDLGILIQLCNNLSDPSASEEANIILNQFRERSDSWFFCPKILSETSDIQLHVIAYNIMSDFLANRWETIEDNVKADFRGFVIETFQKAVSGQLPDSMFGYIVKMVISLIISDFPEGCPDILDIIISMPPTVQLMTFLFSLLDAFFGQNADEKIPYIKIQMLSNSLEEHAQAVFEIINGQVTQNIADISIMKPTLSLMKYFVKSIPPEVIVETEIFQRIIVNCLPNNDLVAETLIFLYEVYELPNLPEELIGLCPEVFKQIVESIRSQLGDEELDFNELVEENELKFKALSSCLTTFLTKQGSVIEIPELAEHIKLALLWILGMTKVSQDVSLQVKMTCVEFWKEISHRVYQENKRGSLSEIITSFYIPIFSDLRRIIIDNMSKPDDLFITLESDGEEAHVTRQRQFDTPENEVYKTQKEVLIYLGNINYEETIGIIQENLTALQSDFDFARYNTLCYSIGAISGVNKQYENEFIIQFVQFTIELIQSCPDDSEEKALISGSLMFVLSQYPRFVSSNYEIFSTLVNKLIEFMHSPKDVVREMAVRSFALIAKPTAKLFQKLVEGKDVPLIVEILNNTFDIASSIANNDWNISFFCSIAQIISSCSKSNEKIEELKMLMAPINSQLTDICNALNPGDPDQVENLVFYLGCNAGIAHQIIGGYFDVQLETIYDMIMMLYQTFSQALTSVLPTLVNPEIQPVVIAYKKVKSHICMILNEFILSARKERRHDDILIPAVMENFVAEYTSSDPIARVPEVLTLLLTMFTKMKDTIGMQVPDLFMTLFKETVLMVKDDYTSFLPFRLPFYKFIHGMVKGHIDVLVNAPEEEFNNFIETIKWGISHPMYDVCYISMQTIEDLFKSMKEKCNPESYEGFVAAYFIPIVRHTIDMITDTVHRFILEDQARFLRKLLGIPISQLDPHLITESIMDLFPNKDPNEIQEYIAGLIDASSDDPRFNELLKQFMISTKKFSPYDKLIDLNYRNDRKDMLKNDGLEFYSNEDQENQE